MDSYMDDALFMNALLITRFFENSSVVLRNLHLTETIESESSTVKILFEDVPELVQEKFRLPADVVKKAISNLKELKDIWD
ncbi:MAG: hypothetical protein KJ666_07590 [Bacteroidetes bacterium]|nr:hypothetical protein [Bacteroidota bacterium]MBU2583878.1 hypothetical protein [Bacteroidota bacterium]